MEKINIAMFGLPKEVEPTAITINEQTLLVRSEIPYEEVFAAIQWAVNLIIDTDKPFVSVPVQRIITDLAVVKYWSNVDCDEIEAIEFDPQKLYEWYDILKHFEVIEKITEIVIPKQMEFFHSTLIGTIDSLITYGNSAVGIVDRLTVKSNEQTQDMTAALSMINDDAQMENVRKLFDLIGKDGLPLATALPPAE